MNNKLLSFLGLACRAGAVVSGEFATEKAVKEGKASLVIVAADASDNTKKLFNDKCSYYEVPVIVYGDKESLGHAIGKELRASLAVTQQSFADGLIQRFNDLKTE